MKIVYDEADRTKFQVHEASVDVDQDGDTVVCTEVDCNVRVLFEQPFFLQMIRRRFVF